MLAVVARGLVPQLPRTGAEMVKHVLVIPLQVTGHLSTMCPSSQICCTAVA